VAGIQAWFFEPGWYVLGDYRKGRWFGTLAEAKEWVRRNRWWPDFLTPYVRNHGNCWPAAYPQSELARELVRRAVREADGAAFLAWLDVLEEEWPTPPPDGWPQFRRFMLREALRAGMFPRSAVQTVN
jgi:hypothetical protein